MRPDRPDALLAAAGLLAHARVDDREVVDHAVAVAVVVLPREVRIVGVDRVDHFLHELVGADVAVTASLVVGAVVRLGVRGFEPLGIDAALRLELALRLLQVVVGHRVTAKVHVAQVRVMDDDAGFGPDAEEELLVQSWSRVVVPDRVVVPRPGSRDLVVRRTGEGVRDGIPFLVVAADLLRRGRELDGHRQALELARALEAGLTLALVGEELLELLRVRCRGVTLRPFLAERGEGLLPRVRASERDPLLGEDQLDLGLVRHPVMLGPFLALEHADGAHLLGHVGVGPRRGERHARRHDDRKHQRQEKPPSPSHVSPSSWCLRFAARHTLTDHLLRSRLARPPLPDA